MTTRISVPRLESAFLRHNFSNGCRRPHEVYLNILEHGLHFTSRLRAFVSLKPANYATLSGCSEYPGVISCRFVSPAYAPA